MKIVNSQIVQYFLVLFILFFAPQQQFSVEAHCHKCPCHCKEPCYNETKQSPNGEGEDVVQPKSISTEKPKPKNVQQRIIPIDMKTEATAKIKNKESRSSQKTTIPFTIVKTNLTKETVVEVTLVNPNAGKCQPPTEWYSPTMLGIVAENFNTKRDYQFDFANDYGTCKCKSRMTNLFVPAQYLYEPIQESLEPPGFEASCGGAGLSKFCAILGNGSVVRAPSNASRAFFFPMCIFQRAEYVCGMYLAFKPVLRENIGRIVAVSCQSCKAISAITAKHSNFTCDGKYKASSIMSPARVCQGPRIQPVEGDNTTYLEPWLSIENFYASDYTFTVPSSGYCICTSTMNGYSLKEFYFPAPWANTFGYKEVTFEANCSNAGGMANFCYLRSDGKTVKAVDNKSPAFFFSYCTYSVPSSTAIFKQPTLVTLSPLPLPLSVADANDCNGKDGNKNDIVCKIYVSFNASEISPTAVEKASCYGCDGIQEIWNEAACKAPLIKLKT